MKRTALARKTPMPRGTGLRRAVSAGEGGAARRGMTPQQARRAAADREYKRLRVAFLAVFTVCACCGGVATDCHHRKGRGPYYLRPETYVALCRPCHQAVGTRPTWAIDMGLSEKRLGV